MTTLQMLVTIHQNNQAVAFLEKKDFYNAVVSSTAAMAQLQEIQRNFPDIREFSSSASARGTFDSLDQCMILSNDIFNIETDPNDEDTRRPFVYGHGIVIPSTTVPFDVLYPILIFNSALSHQLLAQDQQDKATFERYLLKAKKLYRLACQASDHVVDRSLLFQFAVMNNTAVIESQTGNEAQSAVYFNDLMSTTMILVDRGCTSKLQQLRSFLRNLSPFFLHTEKAAGAA